MFLRPISVAAVGVLALGAAVLFGSGCDQLEELVKEVEAHHGTGSGGASGGGTGGAGGGTQPQVCGSSSQCPAGTICTTEEGHCDSPPGCGAPGTGCAAICYGTCEKPSGGPCGRNTCATGEVCCNASCGICSAPDVGCPAIFCGDPEPPAPPSADCKTDADCTLTADYCHGGCDCVAHGGQVGLATCTNPVQCLVDPCGRKTAVCVNNQCTVADAPVR